jgi:hypothetical protein
MVVEGDELVSVSGRHDAEHLLLPKRGTDETLSSKLIVRHFLLGIPLFLTSCRSPRLVDQVLNISRRHILEN